jgi:CrcB protein
MIKLLFVGAGGFVGSVARYALGGVVHRLVPATLFPVGTLTVNVVGCFAIGALSGMGETRGVLAPQTRLFLLIGLLGGFTTFSTFGYESFALARNAEGLKALFNVLLNVALGLSAVWLGHALTRH